MLTDVATKMIWECPLKTRSCDEVLTCIRNWVERVLVCYPGNHTLVHYHADGGAEFIDQRIKSYLLSTFGTTDTPQLNAISERKFRTLGEMT